MIYHTGGNNNYFSDWSRFKTGIQVCLFISQKKSFNYKTGISLPKQRVVGGAKMLGKVSVPTNLENRREGSVALANDAGDGCFSHLFSRLSFLSSSLARYRLKYCLKGPLNPKQKRSKTKRKDLHPSCKAHLYRCSKLPFYNQINTDI